MTYGEMELRKVGAGGIVKVLLCFIQVPQELYVLQK